MQQPYKVSAEDQSFSFLNQPNIEWMLTISAFFDESGKFRDHDVVTFCGIASVAQDFGEHWVADWDQCLHSGWIV